MSTITQGTQRLQRYSQLRRILTTTELLRQFRFGVDTEYVNHEVSDRTGEQWCRRTTYRDLVFLETAGLVDQVETQSGRRWKWIESKPFATMPPERLP